jgi:hypothetical protein
VTHPSLGGHLESDPLLGTEISFLVLEGGGIDLLPPSPSSSMKVDHTGVQTYFISGVPYPSAINPEDREKEIFSWIL